MGMVGLMGTGEECATTGDTHIHLSFAPLYAYVIVRAREG